MSFSSSVNLQFAVLTEFLSSHKPPWLTVVTIPIGFCLINILVNLWISYIINPNKNQAIDERTELEAQVRKIRWNEDGWSKKMIEKKEQKIAALEKKIDRLQNWYWVANFLSLFLSYGGMFIAFQIAMNRLNTSN